MKSPHIEIITIGREILDGRVLDTNSVWLAQKMRESGLIVRHAQKVDDDLERVGEAFSVASKRSNFIVVTGGLGPTSDDLTAEAFARFQHSSLELNREAEKSMKDYLRQINREVSIAQLKQAYLPEGVQVIPNTKGTAPAFYFKEATRMWFFLPGVPREMKTLFERFVLPMLPQEAGYRHYHWVTQFTSESRLQEQLSEIVESLPLGFELAFRTRFPENHVSLFGNCTTEAEKNSFESFCAKIKIPLSVDLLSEGLEPEGLEFLVLQKCKAKKIRLAFVESCTGGLNAHRITEVSGASEVLMASWVTYDNAAKILLGVPEKTISEHGAVSEACSEAMATSGLAQLEKMYPGETIASVSTTGIAGPGGGSPEKPLGLCYSSVALKEAGAKKATLKTLKIQTPFAFERTQNKHYFSQKALFHFLNLI